MLYVTYWAFALFLTIFVFVAHHAHWYIGLIIIIRFGHFMTSHGLVILNLLYSSIKIRNVVMLLLPIEILKSAFISGNKGSTNSHAHLCCQRAALFENLHQN